MRSISATALAVIGFVALCPASAYPHGGPPTTRDILLGSGHMSLVTTHGLFTEDSDWAWICEEASGSSLAPSVTRTPSRWMVGTIYGLRISTDGCNWSDDPELAEQNILRVVQDQANPERVWAATNDGLWVVNGGEPAQLEKPFDFSVRHFGQSHDGSFLVAGFDGPEPVADIGGHRITLPAQTGRIQVLTSDDLGRFYIRFPAGATDRLIRVSNEGAEVLLPSTDLIRDVAAIDSDLYVLFRDGVSWSEDDGLTWSPRRGHAIRCLREGSKGFYACPAFLSPEALLHTPDLPRDPALWEWTSLLDYDQVGEHTCESESDVGSICPGIWDIVAMELGITSPESAPEPEPEPQPVTNTGGGCDTSPFERAHPWLILFLLGFLMLKGQASNRPSATPP